VNAGSFERDAAGAVIFALCFVLPGWLFGRAVRLSRREGERRRGSPSAYVLTGIGILVAVAAFVLWVLSNASREY
jgi:membrane protein DedA with SNARE-associated domain